MVSIKRCVFAALIVLLLGSFAVGQQTNAKIIGTVTDSEGNPLPGVTVEATSPKLVGKASSITDESGTYRLLNLTPGVYKVTFALEGFKSVQRENIQLNLEQTLAVKVTLTLGSIEETVTVTGQAPLIDVKSTTKGMTLTKEVFSSLPRGRDYTSLIATLPGVNFESTQGGGGFSVDGASNAENMYYTDGLNTSDIRGGQQSQNLAYEFVDEVQVKASGYMAEFGGSMGGVVNVVTRAGGNTFSGELMGFLTSSALEGKERDSLRLNPENDQIAEYVNYQDMYGKDKWSRLDAGFGFGGYIIKDKIWFYGSLLPSLFSSDRTVTFLTDDVTSTVNRKTNQWNMQGKISAQLTKNLRFSLSAVNNTWTERGTQPARDGSGSSSYPYADFGFDHPAYSYSGSIDYTIGNNLMVNVRGGYYFENRNNQMLFATEPRYRFLRSVPAAYGMPEDLVRPNNWQNYPFDDGVTLKKEIYTRTALSADLTYFLKLAGDHSWKFGIQYERLRDDIDGGYQFPVVMMYWGYKYSWIDTNGDSQSGTGTYGTYRVYKPPYGFPALVDNAHSNRLALYLQDAWTIGNRFTLSLGIRAEQEKIPSFSSDPLYADKVPLDFGFGDKLAPRLGFTWDVNGDSSLKVFGSYGLFYDVMKLAMPEGSYGGDQWKSHWYTLDQLDWTKIGQDNYYPGTQLGPVIDHRAPSIESTDPDIKPFYQYEISMGVEKKLSENISASLRIVNKNVLRVIEDIGFYNAALGGEQYVIGNPGYGLTLPSTEGGLWDPSWPACPKGKRDYWGVSLALEKRFSDNWLAGFNYTWSSLRGNFGGLNSSDEPNRNDPNVNRYWDYWFNMRDAHLELVDGPLPTDRPSAFKAYGSYAFPWGLTVGLTANARSGRPISTQFTLNDQQGYYPENRFDTGKRTPFEFWMDMYAEYNLKIGKKYKLQINANITNLTNSGFARQNWETINRDSPHLSDDEILAGFDWNTLYLEKDARFMKAYNFFPAIAARLGFKFLF